MYKKYTIVEKLFNARRANGDTVFNIPKYAVYCVKAIICLLIGRVKEQIPTTTDTCIVSRYTYKPWEEVEYHSNGDLNTHDEGIHWREMVVKRGLWKGWMVHVYENGG